MEYHTPEILRGALDRAPLYTRAMQAKMIQWFGLKLIPPLLLRLNKSGLIYNGSLLLLPMTLNIYFALVSSFIIQDIRAIKCISLIVGLGPNNPYL